MKRAVFSRTALCLLAGLIFGVCSRVEAETTTTTAYPLSGSQPAAIGSIAQDTEAARLSAIEHLDRNEFDKAEQILRHLLKSDDADTQMSLAGALFRKGEFDQAKTLCEQALKSSCGEHYTKAMIKLGIAECLLKQDSLPHARVAFEDVLNTLDKVKDPTLVAGLALKGLGSCNEREHRFEDAARAYEEVARLYREFFGTDDTNYGWALLQLSSVYRSLAKPEQARNVYEKSIWIFREANYKRLLKEFSTQTIDPAQLRNCLFGKGDLPEYKNGDSSLQGLSKYLSATNSKMTLPNCTWRKHFNQTEAPGWVWVDPRIPVKRVLICVHGLGLHNRSYESFAKLVAAQGIMSVSFDVRGFGSNLESDGRDTLDLDGCVNDLKAIVNLLRRDYPEKPLFLLGESMGGAIALKVTAESESKLNGLICSVPAGARYKAATTALKVGLHYLTDKNKPMNIGEQVIGQATSEPGLRTSWSSDPRARMLLTPAELMQFDSFMDHTTTSARTIKTTPVILFQGDDDRLVKKAGTLRLFEELGTPEKTLVLLGKTEHLIFEAGQFKDDITIGVLGWMRSHSNERPISIPISSR